MSQPQILNATDNLIPPPFVPTPLKTFSVCAIFNPSFVIAYKLYALPN